MIKRRIPAPELLHAPSGGIFRLSDAELLRLRDDVAAEIARRSPADHAFDLSDIKGQEACKRVLLVAIAGRHSILLAGPAGCGKSMLRSVARQFGVPDTFEGRCCPCGHWNDPRYDCRCTAGQIRRHLARFPDTEITVEVPPVPADFAAPPFRILAERYPIRPASWLRDAVAYARSVLEGRDPGPCPPPHPAVFDAATPFRRAASAFPASAVVVATTSATTSSYATRCGRVRGA